MLVTTISADNTIGGYSLKDMRQLQADDPVVGKIPHDKETGQKPTDGHAI